MKIGITERGDAGLDLSWTDKIKNMDMSILITKNLTPKFTREVLNHMGTDKLIVHCDCTGWGGTWLEPNVPDYNTQLQNLKDLIKNGFPKEQCVLRIDPVIPTDEGIQKLHLVLQKAYGLDLLPNLRVRLSVLDEYAHVKRRLKQAGKTESFYESTRKYPNRVEMAKVKAALSAYPDLKFETCAEPYLSGSNIEHTGCVSEKDLSVFNLKPDTENLNPQNRAGCLCLANKTELLTRKKRCPHGCLYCYWVD